MEEVLDATAGSGERVRLMLFLAFWGRGEVPPAPLRKFVRPAPYRQCDIVRHVQLDPGRQVETVPRTARKGSGGHGLGWAAVCDPRRPSADVVEGSSRFLLRLHLQQTVEVRPVVVPAPPYAQGFGQQPFLHVVADRAAGHAAQTRANPRNLAGEPSGDRIRRSCSGETR